MNPAPPVIRIRSGTVVPVVDLATRESGASDTLERGPMLVEIAEGLVLRPKRRLEATHLPNCADCQHECNCLANA